MEKDGSESKRKSTLALDLHPSGKPARSNALKKLGKFGKQKEQMTPMRDLTDTEKFAEAPMKHSGVAILKREKKRRMNLAKRYYCRLNAGILKLYKHTDKVREDKNKMLKSEFNIDLSTLNQILFNDENRKLCLVFEKESYQFTPFEKEKYYQWKNALQQHRMYRQFQRREKLVDDSDRSYHMPAPFNLVDEDKNQNPVKAEVKLEPAPNPVATVATAPPTEAEVKEIRDEKKKEKEKDVVTAGEDSLEEAKLTKALKVLTQAMESCQTIHNSSVDILSRVKKCHEESQDILKELRKLQKKGVQVAEESDCSDSEEDEGDEAEDKKKVDKKRTKNSKEAKESEATVETTSHLLKASISALNLNDGAKPSPAKSTSMPNISVEANVKKEPAPPHLPQQTPAATARARPEPAAAPAQPQVHAALQPAKRRRDTLPREQIFGDGITILSILRRQLPIHAYEPLGILQSACEELRFAGPILDRLRKIDTAADRMCMVASFIVSGYFGMTMRNRKPFNPLLGETFDYVADEGWRYHSEQVSHHPPVSACHAEGNGWEWFQTLQGTITPNLDGSTSLNCLYPTRLRLAHGEEYRWNKVTTVVQNARAEAEKRRVKNVGEMTVSSSSGWECKMTFYEERNAIRGEIRSASGVLYKLVGCWDKGLNRVLQTNEQERLFEAPPHYEMASRFYGFNKFTMSLNELTPELRPFLPPTDSRFRPDQRFLESADTKRAEEAKKQLEQSQRQRAHLSHRQMWFSEQTDAFSQHTLWLTNRRYWTAKQAGFKDAYSGRMLPLFSSE